MLRFTPPSGLLDRLGPMIAGLAKQLFTAADGETYAIGRFLAVVLMGWGLTAPTGLAVYLMARTDPVSTFDEWVDFIEAMAFYLPALVAGVVGLVTLTIPAERTEGERRARERIKQGNETPATTPAEDDSGNQPPLS